ncbi:MAG: DUF4160 domain-containing protein [Magnetococcales bacterium]|nr:DUF4160 domain-containing protein [Magnetococcales bacterium]
MPVISMFYGLIIRMYFFDDRQHHTPHIHAGYGDMNGVFGIEDGEMLTGELPRQKIRLVQAWIELHRDELMADWKLAMEGNRVFPIDPLK